MEFEKGTNTHISDFNRQIEESTKLDVKLEADKVVDENANVVKIMTIHKSKGLEFPVVMIAGMDKKRNIRSETEMVRMSEKMGIGIDIINEELKYKYPSIYKEIINLEKTKEEKEEEFRILYVAMTRAKEKLIMTAKTKSVKDFLEKINKETYINIYNNKLSAKYIMRVDSYIEMVMIALIEAAILQERGNDLKILKQDGEIEIYFKDILNSSLNSNLNPNSNSNSNSNFKDDNTILNLGNIYIRNVNNLERPLDSENIININILEEKAEDLKEEYIKIYKDNNLDSDVSENSDINKNNIGIEGYIYNRDNIDKDIQKLLEIRYKEYIEEKSEDNDKKVLEKISVSAITTMEKKNINNNIDNNKDDSSKINMIISYDKPKFLRSEKIEGKEKGTILHSILELLDIVPFSTLIKLNVEEKKDIILQYIEKLRKEKIYSDEELEIVDVDVLLNYINTYIYTYLAKSVENNNIKIYKEKTIYLKLTKEDIEFLKTKYMISENLEEGQILQGVLDLYIVDEEKKEIYIVDYKTDKIFKEEYYKERYNVQIGIYEYSIFKQYGKDYNYKKIIYSTTMKKIIDLN